MHPRARALPHARTRRARRSPMLAFAALLVTVAPSAHAAPDAHAAARADNAGVTPVAHVETRGEGPVTLVLVPGLGCEWDVWDAFMTRNAARYTMHAVTLPGFGGTQPPPAPRSDSGAPWLDNAMDAIATMIEERGLEKPIVVGHSMGGHLAMRFATERPDLIGGAVSVDGLPAIPLGPPTMTLAEREQMVNTMIAPQFRGLTDEQWTAQQRQWVRGMVTNPARADALAERFLKSDQRIVTQYLLELFRADITPALANIGAPTVIIGAVPPAGPGANPELSRAIWTNVGASAPGAALVTLENCRHFITEDRPDALDDIVDSFVKGEDVKRHGDGAP